MKKKTVKQTLSKPVCVCDNWPRIILALFLGCFIGYVAHYMIVNWHSFFVTCPDGNRPDKNGCCGNEIYTDAGDGWMVCCPEGGDNCFPPIK